MRETKLQMKLNTETSKFMSCKQVYRVIKNNIISRKLKFSRLKGSTYNTKITNRNSNLMM